MRDTFKKLVRETNTACLGLVILGIILCVGGGMLYRADSSFKGELSEGRYSVEALHAQLYIESPEDLVSTEKDLYAAALKYRELNLIFIGQLLGFMKALILIGISFITTGVGFFIRIRKLRALLKQPSAGAVE